MVLDRIRFSMVYICVFFVSTTAANIRVYVSSKRWVYVQTQITTNGWGDKTTEQYILHIPNGPFASHSVSLGDVL